MVVDYSKCWIVMYYQAIHFVQMDIVIIILYMMMNDGGLLRYGLGKLINNKQP